MIKDLLLDMYHFSGSTTAKPRPKKGATHTGSLGVTTGREGVAMSAEAAAVATGILAPPKLLCRPLAERCLVGRLNLSFRGHAGTFVEMTLRQNGGP
jgi:hypothetical protein